MLSALSPVVEIPDWLAIAFLTGMLLDWVVRFSRICLWTAAVVLMASIGMLLAPLVPVIPAFPDMPVGHELGLQLGQVVMNALMWGPAVIGGAIASRLPKNLLLHRHFFTPKRRARFMEVPELPAEPKPAFAKPAPRRPPTDWRTPSIRRYKVA